MALGLKSQGLKDSWLKILGLKVPFDFGVEKSGVEVGVESPGLKCSATLGFYVDAKLEIMTKYIPVHQYVFSPLIHQLILSPTKTFWM